jgi:hypothetical protein
VGGEVGWDDTRTILERVPPQEAAVEAPPVPPGTARGAVVSSAVGTSVSRSLGSFAHSARKQVLQQGSRKYLLPTADGGSDGPVVAWRRWWAASGMCEAQPADAHGERGGGNLEPSTWAPFGPARASTLHEVSRAQQLDRVTSHALHCAPCRCALARAERVQAAALPLALCVVVAYCPRTSKVVPRLVILLVGWAVGAVARVVARAIEGPGTGPLRAISTPRRSEAASN